MCRVFLQFVRHSPIYKSYSYLLGSSLKKFLCVLNRTSGYK